MQPFKRATFGLWVVNANVPEHVSDVALLRSASDAASGADGEKLERVRHEFPGKMYIVEYTRDEHFLRGERDASRPYLQQPVSVTLKSCPSIEGSRSHKVRELLNYLLERKKAAVIKAQNHTRFIIPPPAAKVEDSGEEVEFAIFVYPADAAALRRAKENSQRKKNEREKRKREDREKELRAKRLAQVAEEQAKAHISASQKAQEMAKEDGAKRRRMEEVVGPRGGGGGQEKRAKMERRGTSMIAPLAEGQGCVYYQDARRMYEFRCGEPGYRLLLSRGHQRGQCEARRATD